MPRLRLLVLLLAPSSLLIAGCGASADVVATYKFGGGLRVIEASASGWGRIQDWRDGKPEEGYGLTTPQGQNLEVFRLQGRWIVADAKDRTDLMRAGMPRPKASPIEGRFFETGEEAVGQWTGTAYTMQSTSDNKRPRQCGSWSHFVVMHGAGLEVFGRVLRNNLRYATKDSDPSPCQVQAEDLMGKGVPIFVDDPTIILEKLERGKIDPARFRLPSRLLTRAELVVALKAAYPVSNDPPRITTIPPPKGPPR